MNGWELYWRNQRNKLKREFEEKGITHCEIGLPGCYRDNFLSFAHLHKRDFYHIRGNEKLLGDFNQVVLACIPCHNQIETNKDLTEKTFQRLRP